MLRRAGYWGLAQLDFVQDSDGPVLIDVNPRYYACLPLALAGCAGCTAVQRPGPCGRRMIRSLRACSEPASSLVVPDAC